jgi:hypothetical protein
MNVILHEHVRVEITARTPARTEQRGQVELAVLVVDEAHAAVVPALDQMKGLTSKDGAWGAWHARMNTRRPLANIIEMSVIGTVS